jgi:CRISPR-associated endoribonuclease Cas6
MPFPEFKEEMTINMLSPITCYSTLKKADGKSKVYYYNPFEEEFSLLLKNNLKKKYQLIFGKTPKNFEFEITPYKVSKKDEKIVLYKKITKRQRKPTTIRAWMGVYFLKGDPQILKLSYDAGLGSKNSQGFGCWEVWKENRSKNTASNELFSNKFS